MAISQFASFQGQTEGRQPNPDKPELKIED
jgi:hypothetical protein